MSHALGNEMLAESRGGEVRTVSSGKALKSSVASSGKSHAGEQMKNNSVCNSHQGYQDENIIY